MPPKPSDQTQPTSPPNTDAATDHVVANNGILAAKPANHDKIGLTVSNFAATLTSGIAGGIAYSLLSKTELGMAAGLLGSALTGAAVNTGVKAGLEQVLVSQPNRDVGYSDLMWGAANGLSGSVGAIAEKAAGKAYAEKIGMDVLGRQEDAGRIREAGYRMFDSSLQMKFKSNILRGMAGGAAGTFVYSLPHGVADHMDQFKNGQIGAGLEGVGTDTLLNTTFGTLTGGALGGVSTALFNARDIAGYTRASFTSDANLDKLQIGHVNDVHSSFVDDKGGHPMSRLSTAAHEMRANAAGTSADGAEVTKPTTVHTINAGDEFGGTEIDSSTHNGLIENSTLQRALGTTVRTMGNHSVDKSDSIIQWLRNAAMLHNEIGETNTVVSNVIFDNAELMNHAHVFSEAGLDPKLLSPENYIVGTGPNSIVRPYLVKTINGAEGPTKVGYIGLVTEDIDRLGVQVNVGLAGANANQRSVNAARAAVALFKADPDNADVNKLILVSHLGRDTDMEVAKHVDSISAIIGAHSHDAQPTPLWVRNPTGWDVPIVQAGNDAKWLGDLQLAFKSDGSGAVDKYFSKGKLIPLTEAVPEDPAINEYIQKQPFYARIQQLHQAPGYGEIKPTGEFSADSVRAKQTQLGAAVSDGLFAGINKHLAEADTDVKLNAVLKHSGDIRKPIPGQVNLTGWHFSNLFCNGENSIELTIAKMKGEDIRRALEYGVHDIPGPTPMTQTITGKLANFGRSLFQISPEVRPDYSGNFLQTSGLRYGIDLSKAPIRAAEGALVDQGGRIKNMEIWVPDSEGATPTSGAGRWEPVKPTQDYNIATLFHPVDKWAKAGIFDDVLGIKPGEYDLSSLKSARVQGLHSRFETETGVNSPKSTDPVTNEVTRGLGLSQPKLMVDYLSGTTTQYGLLGSKLQVDADGNPTVHPDNLGPLDGRIQNVTPTSDGASWKAIASQTTVKTSNDARQAAERSGAL